MLIGLWVPIQASSFFQSVTHGLCSFYKPIAQGIHAELASSGYHLVFEGYSPPGDETRGLEALLHKGLDGFIVAPAANPAEDHELLAQMIAKKIPLVLIDKRLPEHRTDLVIANDYLGAQTVIRCLIEMGHRRIGIVGMRGPFPFEERYRAYRRTMLEHGLKIDENWVQLNDQVYKDHGGEAAGRLLSMDPDRRPTAIFALNDFVAVTVAEMSRSLGLEVPADVSIVGFGDIPTVSGEESRLTTYAIPEETMGREAARLLVRRIENPSSSTETVLLEGRLVVRQSTAPPR